MKKKNDKEIDQLAYLEQEIGIEPKRLFTSDSRVQQFKFGDLKQNLVELCLFDMTSLEHRYLLGSYILEVNGAKLLGERLLTAVRDMNPQSKKANAESIEINFAVLIDSLARFKKFGLTVDESNIYEKMAGLFDELRDVFDEENTTINKKKDPENYIG